MTNLFLIDQITAQNDTIFRLFHIFLYTYCHLDHNNMYNHYLSAIHYNKLHWYQTHIFSHLLFVSLYIFPYLYLYSIFFLLLLSIQIALLHFHLSNNISNLLWMTNLFLTAPIIVQNDTIFRLFHIFLYTYYHRYHNNMYNHYPFSNHYYLYLNFFH